jgi:hypothetical protein
MNSRHADVVNEIESQKALSSALTQKMDALILAFRDEFKKENKL